MENKENEEKKGLYLNFKTYHTSMKGIFYNDPNNIKTHIEFIKHKDLILSKRGIYYLFRTKNDDIKKNEEHGDNEKENREFMFLIKFDKDHFILNSIIHSKNILIPTENNINYIKNKIW